MGIGEALRQALAKLGMRAAEAQAKTVCGDLELCEGLKDGIESVTHAIGQQRLERTRQRRSVEVAEYVKEDEE